MRAPTPQEVAAEILRIKESGFAQVEHERQARIDTCARGAMVAIIGTQALSAPKAIAESAYEIADAMEAVRAARLQADGGAA